jgi:gamma-glutamyltranspeptidase/glutathione hydrolase
MLTVVEPTSNGIGGDAFALVWIKNDLHGLNSSGYAPKSISSDLLIKKGYNKIPKYGFIPVTVPGIPAAWAELSKKFGKLSLSEVLNPAIETAKNGFAVTPTVSKFWNDAFNKYSKELSGEEFKNWFKVFAPNGRTPRSGENWKSNLHAETLKELAESNCESFYRGNLADKIHNFSQKYGGYIKKSDLENYYPEWVKPIKINYKGYEVCEIPPNGHGISALMALNIFKNFNSLEKDNVETYHQMIESMKLSFADAKEYISDPRFTPFSSDILLSEKYAEKRSKLIGDTAMIPRFGNPSSGGTVYLCTADSEGNMVSYIQSNYMGFGSGLVVPETGIALHNRGNNFVLEQNHPNCIEGGKKPYHTIIPGFLLKNGNAVGPFGVMGGFMQPQGHLQVIINTIDFGLNPQDALDAPRWQWTNDKIIKVEQSFPPHIIQELIEKGHEIIIDPDYSSFGRGQIIWKTDDGTLCGGTESRCDGYIALM